MPVGRPAIVTPNRGTAEALRLWQQQVDNIRERFRVLEAAFTTLETTDTARAGVTAAALAAIRARLTAIETIIANLGGTSLISDEPADDGDVLTWSDADGLYVPELPEPASGGILPVVTGEVPPVLVYLDDGSLVYTEIE